MTALLELQAVTVRFGGITAANEVSFSVERGEIRGLIGPNGAGKTTIINAITGAVALSAGAIRFDGRPIARKRAFEISRLGVGRTFQHVEPFADMTVRDNVLIGLGRRAHVPFGHAALGTHSARETERESIATVERILELFGLLPYRHGRAAELPFGLLKRMDLARALAGRPSLLLMDEPTSGMSESEADSAIATARQLAASEGITLLVVEHNMRVMMALADRITVMQNGRVLTEGTPAEIQRNSEVIDAYLGESEDAPG
jgi:branched-chain amino acid transport system ATP-binding protein